MEFKSVAERPKVAAGRSGEPNPFLDAVRDLVTNGGKDATVAAVLNKSEVGEQTSRTVTRNGKAQTETVFTGVERARRQLRDAGAKMIPPVSVRSHVAMDAPRKGEATLTFWFTDRVAKKVAAPADGSAGGQVGEGAPTG